MKSLHSQPAGQNETTNDFTYQYAHVISAFHQSLLRKSRAHRRKSAPAAKIGGGRAKAKIHYTTLAEALQARSSMARKRGRRCKRLRPYQVRGEWFLTKMTKGQVRSFAGGRQSAYGW